MWPSAFCEEVLHSIEVEWVRLHGPREPRAATIGERVHAYAAHALRVRADADEALGA